MNRKDNVNIEDIKEIESLLNITLTNEQRESLLMEYNKVVMDKGESWDILIRELINKIV
jgi:hypothetical protein